MPSVPKQKAPKGGSGGGSSSAAAAAAKKDPRFASLAADPRFRLPSKKHTHVKLDKRLSRILHDDDFARKASVDRYGRKVERDQGRKELERLYRIASDEEDEDEDEADDDDVVLKELKQAGRSGYDPARDGGFSTSDSDSDDEEVGAEDEEEAELPDEDEEEKVPQGEITTRIGIVNLDWDNIRAVDLMAVASSFAPPDGRIINVSVYPSKFGRERMDREELEGPPKEIFEATDKDSRPAKSSKKSAPIANDSDSESNSDQAEDSDSEDERIKKELLQEDTGAEFNSAALRRYQLDRLKYFYAVVCCSSKDVAKALYDAMDGREYLSSANFFDLRFVPDEVDFDEDTPRDICDELPDGYRPEEFVTDALTHSKVKLTWDADDNKRKEVQKRAFSRKDIDENDMLAYIGSASDSEEDDEEDEIIEDDGPDADMRSTTSKATTKQARRDAMRAALGLDLEPIPHRKGKKEDRTVGDMQITFTSALSGGKQNGGAVFENEAPPPEETTAEKYKRKERERKAARKERARAKRENPEGEVEPTTAKGNTSKEDDVLDEDSDIVGQDDDVDAFDDPFFEDPKAVQEKARALRKAEKARLRREREEDAQASSAQRAELELLMMDDDAATQGGVQHFSMKEIERAEKAGKKKPKKKLFKNKKNSARDDEATKGTAVVDDFQIEVKDPRFASLFESHEFAIDPTNPRFRDTKGMRSLLEETRRRRTEQIERPESKKRAREHVKDDGVLDLVNKVKKKIKQ